MNGNSLVDDVYLHLKNAIISLEFPPSSPLREAALAESFGTSRTPVREALRRLEAEGLVVIVSGRGASVGNLSVREVLNAYEIRELLEPYSARQAARKGLDPARVQSLLDRIERLSDEPATPEEMEEREAIDTEFHLLIAESTGNELLAKTLLDMRSRVQRVFAHIGGGGRFRLAQQEHRAILEAILRGDEDTAAEVMLRHLQGSRSRMLDISLSR